MKVLGSLVTVMVCLAAVSFGLDQEIYTASQNHILRVRKLGDVAPQTMADIDGRVLLSLAVHEDRMYWSEKDQDRIYRANLDGTDEIIWLSGYAEPFGLTVHPGTGMLYWHDDNHIYRASSDGSSVGVVIASALIGTFALDTGSGKLVWMEGNSGALKKADLDGSNIADITPAGLPSGGAAAHFPCALAIASDALFFYHVSHNAVQHKVYKTDFDGAYVEEALNISGALTLLTSMSFGIEDEMLYVGVYDGSDPVWPFSIKRFQTDNGYQETALTRGEQEPYALSMGEIMNLYLRRNLVVHRQGEQSVLWFADRTGVKKKALAEIQILADVLKDVADMAVVYDENASTGTVFWSEMDLYGGPSHLFSVNTGGANRQTIATGTGGIGGIAVDAENNRLYRTNVLGQGIIRSTLAGGSVSAVATLLSWWGYPIGLALDKVAGKLYFATISGSAGKIGVHDLNTAQSDILLDLGFMAFGLAHDSTTNRLYVTDDNMRVYTCAIDGSGLTLIPDFRGGNLHVDSEGGWVYGARSTVLQRAALDGTDLEELGSLPAYHGVIAMHKFEYRLTILGPQEVRVGESVTLRIGVLPQLTGAVTYEWYKDGVLIEGAHQDTYTMNAVSFDDAGEYQLLVTDESKRVYLSEPFVLTVNEAMPAGGLPAMAMLLAIMLLAGATRTIKRSV